jgi:hypothetical protein
MPLLLLLTFPRLLDPPRPPPPLPIDTPNPPRVLMNPPFPFISRRLERQRQRTSIYSSFLHETRSVDFVYVSS